MTSQVREVRIKIDAKGAPQLRKASKEFGKLSKDVKRSADSLGLLKNAFLTFGAGFGIQEITRSLDEFNLLSDRIKVFTGDAEEASRVFDSLGDTARNTRSSIAGLAEVYNRVALATSDLGVSSEAILGVTEALQQTFRISGATIAEATGATIQLTQGLSAGALRGQELRSVLESNAVLSGLLAEKFGVARGQLIKLAESGAITSKKVFEVLGDNFDELNSKAGQLGTTFSQALTISLDSVRRSLFKLDSEFGISDKITSAILNMTSSTESLTRALVVLGTTALPLIISQLRRLTLLVISNPLGAAFAAISVGAFLFVSDWEKNLLKAEKAWLEFVKFIGSPSNSGTSILDDFRIVSEELVKSFDEATKAIKDFFKESEQAASRNRFSEAAKAQTDLFLKAYGPILDFLPSLEEIWRDGFVALGKNVLKVLGTINDGIINFIITPLLKVVGFLLGPFEKPVIKLFDKLGGSVSKAFSSLSKFTTSIVDRLSPKIKKGLDDAGNSADGLGKKVGDASKSVSDSVRDYVSKGLKDLGSSTEDIDKRIAELNKRISATSTGKGSVSDLKKFIKEAADQMKGFEKPVKIVDQALADLNKSFKDGDVALSDYNQKLLSIRNANVESDFLRGKITLDQYNKALAQTTSNLELVESATIGAQIGVSDYIKSVGTLAEGIASSINGTFKSLENQFVDFVKTGKFQFRDLADSIINDLIRISVQQSITRPLAGALGNALSGAFSGTSLSSGPIDASANVGGQTVLASANGNAFMNGNLQKFATGGIVDKPTFFNYGNNQRGLMGEAGSEAILPLKRQATGNLGVEASGLGSNVQVNVINNGSNEVSTRESRGPNGEKVIDVMIENKVKGLFASGKMDRQMSSNYGLRRKGVS